MVFLFYILKVGGKNKQILNSSKKVYVSQWYGFIVWKLLYTYSIFDQKQNVLWTIGVRFFTVRERSYQCGKTESKNKPADTLELKDTQGHTHTNSVTKV